MNDRWGRYTLVLSLLLAMVPFVALSLFHHPVGVDDWDYLNACFFPGLNFWEQQAAFYGEVTGRFTATFFLTTIQWWAGLTTFKIVPVVFFSSAFGECLLFDPDNSCAFTVPYRMLVDDPGYNGIVPLQPDRGVRGPLFFDLSF